MATGMISQADLEQLVSVQLLEKEWSFALAAQILCYIHLYKVGGTITIDDNVIESCITESIAFLEKGLQGQQLHDVSSRRSSIPKEYVTSAAVGITASTSPVISSSLTMISPLAPLALAAIPLLFKKKHKHQKDTKQVALAPSKVVAYAKLHGKWIDSEKLPGINVQESMDTNESCVKHSSGSLSADEVQSQKPEDNESRILLLNSLKLYEVDTNLILPQIFTEDLKHLLILISPPETPDSAHLAEKNDRIRKRKVKAINFMLQQIESKCKCNHSNLAKVALKNFDEWKDASEKLLSPAQLKELSILIVPPERRYSSNQHTKNPLYDPSQCKCQKPNHKPASCSAKTPKKQ